MGLTIVMLYQHDILIKSGTLLVYMYIHGTSCIGGYHWDRGHQDNLSAVTITLLPYIIPISNFHQNVDYVVLTVQIVPSMIGEYHTGHQEHFYLEPQSALVVPGNDNELDVYCSVQSMNALQVRSLGRRQLINHHLVLYLINNH